MLLVVLVCILVFLTVIEAIVIAIICFVFKRKLLALQEHIYDSVSAPAPSTRTGTLVSKSTKLTNYDVVKKPSGSKFVLSDNVAYSSYKPLSAVETIPNAESTAADL